MRGKSQQIVGNTGRLGIVFDAERVKDVLQAAMLGKKAPYARADRVQAEILLSGKIKQHALTGDVLEKHFVGTNSLARKGDGRRGCGHAGVLCGVLERQVRRWDMTGKEDVRRDIRALLGGLLRPHLPALLLVLLLMTAQSAAILVQPWLAGVLSERLLRGGATAQLLWGLFLLVAAQALLGYLLAIRLKAVSGRLVADTGARVYAHLQSLPLAWHNERRRGDVLTLLTGDVHRLAGYLTGTLLPLLPLLLTFLGALAMMLKMAPLIAVAIAILLPLLMVVLRVAGRQLRPLGHAVAQSWADQSAQAEQNLDMLPVIKGFATGEREAARYRERTEAVRRLELQQAKLEGAIMPVVRVVSAGVVLLLLAFAGGRIAEGELTTAQLVSLFLYGFVLIGPVSQLVQVYGSTMTARGAMQRLGDALVAEPERDAGTHVFGDMRGDVQFRGLGFSYPARPPLFEDFTLHVRAGETLAITGHNGAGKSTLAHLLLRLVEPQAGQVMVDGMDVRDVTLASLRGRIGLVSQQVQLFNASVADNIAYGRADAGRAEMEAAARAARAHEFVMQLPNGYDTMVGDQGVRLSGGQKQRIALARALLKDPALLILDEATAMFDPDGEQEFIRECHALLSQRTVLLITHRPASLRLADRIVRIVDGKLVEQEVRPSP